jgi:PAS domain S-box-containing protein
MFSLPMPDATIQPDDNAELRRSEEQLRLALDAGRMGTWDWDIRTNRLTWTGHLEVIHGFAPGTFPGSFEAFMAVVHPEDREQLEETINKSLAARTHFEIEFRNPHPDGSLHWIGGRGRALYDEHGQPVRMIGIGYDLTARKHAEHSARFLAEASSALAELIDYESTLQMLATLAVPEFADWCAIDLVGEGGELRRIAVAHVDPDKVRMAHELHAKYPPDPTALHGVHQVIRTGQTELVSDVAEAMLRDAARDAEHERILLALGLRSYMCVPLALRGKTIGAVVFINAESGRRYTPADVALAEELARRASVAVDNARLYADLREADRRKDEFLAILAHELRNPLAPIGNGLRILRSGPPESRERTHAIIERQFQHLVRLVDDLLDISRIRRGKIELRREAISLVAVVARAIEQTQPLFDAQSHVLSVHFPPEQLSVFVDPVRIAQVIGNLLGHAA